MAELTPQQIADLVFRMSPDDKSDFAKAMRAKQEQPPKGMPQDGEDGYVNIGVVVAKALNHVSRLIDNAEDDPDLALQACDLMIGHAMLAE